MGRPAVPLHTLESIVLVGDDPLVSLRPWLGSLIVPAQAGDRGGPQRATSRSWARPVAVLWCRPSDVACFGSGGPTALAESVAVSSSAFRSLARIVIARWRHISSWLSRCFLNPASLCNEIDRSMSVKGRAVGQTVAEAVT